MRIKLAIATAVIGSCVIGVGQAHAGCTTVLKDKVAKSGTVTVKDATAYERCVV